MIKVKFYSLAVLLLCFLLIPLWAGDYFLHVLIMVFLYAYMSGCYNLVAGYTGILDLAVAAYFGIGAYTSTLLFTKWGITPWIGMFAGAILSGATGSFFGFLCFRYRVKGIYFVLATLVFPEILRMVTNNIEWAGGSSGLLVTLKGSSPFLFQFQGKLPYYYVILVMVLCLLVITWSIERSRMGHYFVAIRDNEEAADSLGVPTFRIKIYAVAISSSLMAFGGTFYAQYFLYISPDVNFGIDVLVQVLLRSLVGGVGTVLGPLVGAIAVGPLTEFLRVIFERFAGVSLMAFAIVLILVVIYFPEGIVGIFQRVYHSYLEKEKKAEIRLAEMKPI